MKNYNVVAMAIAVGALPLLGLSTVTMPVVADDNTEGKAVAHVAQPQALADLRPAEKKRSRMETAILNFGQAKLKGVKKSRSTRKAAVSTTTSPEYRTLVTQFAREYGVPAALAHAIVTVESNYYPKALGKAGEIGLMQIKPSTARGMGFRGSSHDLYHPETNIKYGMKYLAAAYTLGGKTTCGTILKYNAGHGAKRMNPISSAYCAKVKRMLAE